MLNLKPCPFCVSDDVHPQGMKSFAVVCNECGANGPVIPRGDMSIIEAYQEAERLWNESAQGMME